MTLQWARLHFTTTLRHVHNLAGVQYALRSTAVELRLTAVARQQPPYALLVRAQRGSRWHGHHAVQCAAQSAVCQNLVAAGRRSLKQALMIASPSYAPHTLLRGLKAWSTSSRAHAVHHGRPPFRALDEISFSFLRTNPTTNLNQAEPTPPAPLHYLPPATAAHLCRAVKPVREELESHRAKISGH